MRSIFFYFSELLPFQQQQQQQQLLAMVSFRPTIQVNKSTQLVQELLLMMSVKSRA